MPKVRGLTKEDRQKDYGEWLYWFLKTKCRAHTIHSLPRLAEKLDVEYPTLYQSIKRGAIRATTMREIIHALDMTDADIIKMTRGPGIC